MTQLIINPRDYQKSACVYTVIDAQTFETIFITASRSRDFAKLSGLYANPAFDVDRPIIVNLVSYYPSYPDAVGALTIWVRENGMPTLNKVSHLNRYGLVRCNETGIVYRNASTASNALGIPRARKIGRAHV